ncbi:MAG TPA: UDP-galactopyranose mutase [Firmicutes bacterium]|nr:UDP-galactopyranose mutase [Bacillota bacterium]
MRFDAVVIGAGFAGSVAARTLAEKGKKVLIIEKLKHLAGHCHDCRNESGIMTHTYGPHIFHTNYQDVWDFLNRFSEFRLYQHKVLSYVEGNFVPFPINRDTIKNIFDENISVNQMEAFFKTEVRNSSFQNPPQNFRDVVVSQVGERIYDLFYKNYTIKQWQVDPEELSTELANRIPIRSNRDYRYFTDRYQGIPKIGYTKLVEKIVDHQNISVLLNADYFDYKMDLQADQIVYTGELDRYFDYKYGKLEYRSLKLEFTTEKQEWYQPSAVVNYPNDYDWTRITEFKHMTGEISNTTTLCYEYPKSTGEPYYIVMNQRNINLRQKYWEEAQKDKHVIFIGRLAQYQYFNMDQVIKEVFLKLQALEK